MTSTSRHRSTAALAAGALSLALGCGFDPSHPELRHELNAAEIDTNEDLVLDATAQDQLRGALEMLYGTPANPGYMMLEAWIDDELDPNPASYGLDDDAFERLRESNAFHFRAQIAAIRDATSEADLDAVLEPVLVGDLWDGFLELRDELPEDGLDGVLYADDDGNEVTWRDEAIYLFESYYPTLAASAEMYRQQCYHCHGVSGGGDGSTAPYLEPRPRDYRKGIFKFTALRDKSRPRHEDLFRILTEGVYTTAMPSFRRFSDAQIHGLVDYVTLLSKRGETELLLVSDFNEDDRFGGIEKITETYQFVEERWQGAGDKVIAFEGEVPEPTPERIARGRELFLGGEGAGANCVSCHGVDGRGGGPSAFERDPETGELVPVKDDWGNEISPRDLTRGVFRFGRRPIDLYRRVYAGINGTPMPEHIGMQLTEPDGSTRPLSEDDVWNLVHFVRSLSTHSMATARADASAETGAH